MSLICTGMLRKAWYQERRLVLTWNVTHIVGQWSSKAHESKLKLAQMGSMGQIMSLILCEYSRVRFVPKVIWTLVPRETVCANLIWGHMVCQWSSKAHASKLKVAQTGSKSIFFRMLWGALHHERRLLSIYIHDTGLPKLWISEYSEYFECLECLNITNVWISCQLHPPELCMLWLTFRVPPGLMVHLQCSQNGTDLDQ